MKQNKSIKDHFYKEAKEAGYFARSVYKLEEIDLKYKIIPSKNRTKPFIILDLGASPGSWLQYLDSKLLDKDIIVAIDINDIKINSKKINFFKKSVFDFTSIEVLNITKNKLDAVISDMAPKTTGLRIKDQEDSLELAYQALKFAIELLNKNGNFVCKFFQIISPDVKKFTTEVKKYFKETHVFKPKSSRKESYECFIVGKSFLANAVDSLK